VFARIITIQWKYHKDGLSLLKNTQNIWKPETHVAHIIGVGCLPPLASLDRWPYDDLPATWDLKLCKYVSMHVPVNPVYFAKICAVRYL